MSKKKLIVVGGGFVGLSLLKRLKNSPMEIVLLDKQNHHLFQPLLYQVATAMLSPNDICTSLRQVFSKYHNISVMMGEVVKIDKVKSKIYLKDGSSMDYDYLVLGVGSKHSYFNNDHFEEYAPGIKTAQNAITIRERLLTSFEIAEKHPDRANKYLTFVIVGGGPTGVEFAGTISELVNKTFRNNFRNIDTSKTNIILVEGSKHLLQQFNVKLSLKAEQYLRDMNVNILTNRFVTNIEKDAVYIGEQRIETCNVIWAAGNVTPKFLQSLETEQDRLGRVIVNQDLTIPDYENIFVAGDCAHCTGKNNLPLPGTAAVAIQQGKYLGNLFLKRDRYRYTPKNFKYFDKGSLATIATGKAVCSYRNINITGWVAWTLWVAVHLFYLSGFRNQISVTMAWISGSISGYRNSRIIYKTID